MNQTETVFISEFHRSVHQYLDACGLLPRTPEDFAHMAAVHEGLEADPMRAAAE